MQKLSQIDLLNTADSKQNNTKANLLMSPNSEKENSQNCLIKIQGFKNVLTPKVKTAIKKQIVCC